LSLFTQEKIPESRQSGFLQLFGVPSFGYLILILGILIPSFGYLIFILGHL